MNLAIGIFCILHGIVHLLYAGHSLGLYQMQPEMSWPVESWVAPLVAGGQVVRPVAAAGAVIAATAFLLAGLAVMIRVPWGQPLTVAAAVFSSAFFLLFWNGRFAQLANQGLVGVAINAAIVAIAFTALRL